MRAILFPCESLFSPSRQGRKDLYTLRSLGVLRAFAREKTACESLITREIFSLAKPPRSLRPVYPAQPWRSLRLCERKNHASDIAAKIAKTCIPCAALAFFAPLREKKSCERYYFLAGVFSRQAAKVAKTYIIPFRCSSEEAE